MTHLAFRLTSRRLATALLPIALAMGCAEGEESSMSMETSSSSSSSSGSDGGGGAGGLGGAGGEATTSSSSSSSSSSGGGAGGAGGQGGAGGAGGQGGAGGAGGMNWMPPVGTADYPAESEPNNLKPSANDLAPATLGFTASLHPLGDIDVFAVTVQNPNSSLKIAVSDGMGGCPPFANMLTRVFGPSGLLASKSGNCPKLSPPASPGLGQLDPGTYFVQVESANLKEVPFYVVELSVISAGCGDGTVQPGSGEQCDDSNTVSGDGCSDTCQVETACGDGKLFVIVGEQCDDGNTADGDGCSSSCVIEGKNFTMEAEPNDAATPNPVDGFDGVVASIQPLGDQDLYTFNVVVPGSSARIEVTNAKGGCPNGFDTKIYLYDPANAEVAADDDDGANSCSKIIPETDPGAQNLVVGTYTIKVEEFGNNATTPFYVLEVKVTPPGCGDLLLSVGEQCDDGNTASGDGCTSTCQLEAACGDGKAHAVLGEQCDDGNTASGDGCSSSCQLEGKSLVNEVEPNDPASMSPTSLAGYQGAVGAISPPGDKDVYSFAVTAPGSTAVIKVTNGFGGCPAGFDSILTLKDPNGAVLVTDDNDGPDSCSLITPALDPAAQSLPIGTYTVTVEENGNNALQPYYVLEVIVAAPGCGDALMQAGETCDDGNAADGDGCDSSCHLELNLRQEAEPNGVGDPATSLAGYEGGLGAISANGDVDVFSFLVTVPGSSVKIEVTDGLGGCPLGFDSELRLLNVNGSELAFDDDDGVDLCSVLAPFSDAAATNLAVGTYKVQVNEHGNNSAQDFYVVLVHVLPPGCGDGLRTGMEQCDDGNLVPGDGCDASCISEAPWEIEPNNSSLTATSPWAGTDIWRGSIRPVGDVDYYVFNFPGGGATLTLETSDVGNPQECGFDSMIHLLDANGVELAKDDDDGVDNCSKLSSSLDPALANLPLGTYFVWMQRYSNTQEIAGYDLTLTIQ